MTEERFYLTLEPLQKFDATASRILANRSLALHCRRRTEQRRAARRGGRSPARLNNSRQTLLFLFFLSFFLSRPRTSSGSSRVQPTIFLLSSHARLLSVPWGSSPSTGERPTLPLSPLIILCDFFFFYYYFAFFAASSVAKSARLYLYHTSARLYLKMKLVFVPLCVHDARRLHAVGLKLFSPHD